jgi:outer membrane protein assembly factor BamB
MPRFILAMTGVSWLIACGVAISHADTVAKDSSSAMSDKDWPQFLGPDHNGKSREKGLLKEWPANGPKLLWKVSTVGSGYSQATIADGTVCVTGDEGRKMMVYAFDLAGHPLWKSDGGPAFTGDHPGARSSVSLDSGNAYVLSGIGVLICYDAKTGNRKWFVDLKKFGGHPGGWGYAESPLVYKNMVIAKAGGRNCVLAFDKISGKGIWGSTGINAEPEYASCVPVNYNDLEMIVTGTKEGIMAVDARNGKLLWGDRFAAGNTANCPTPDFSDGYIFWANGYGKGGICLKLTPKGVSEAWMTREMECHHGGYIIDDGKIYGNHAEGWNCLDLKTGKVLWTNKGVGKGSVAWADGMLYLFGENGGQAALATCSAEGLRITGRVKVDGKGPSWAHPSIAGGRLYLRYDSNLYCFDVKGSG